MMKEKGARRLIKRLKEGDVVLVSEKGLQHAVSRMLQRSKWHHVMLYIGKGKTIESTPRKGTHICDLRKDLTEKKYIAYKILRNKNLTQRRRKNVVETALKHFKGKKFSFVQYAKILFGRILHPRKGGSKSLVCKPGHKCNTNSVACSNMVAMVYYEAGLQISERYMPEYVIPGDYETAKIFSVVLKGNVG